MEQLSPTRMNMLARRAQIKLAADGVNLLKGKREALLKELLSRARALKALRNELHRRGRVATATLVIARAMRGTPEVNSTGIAGRRELSLEVTREKVWGLQLGNIQHSGVVRSHKERGIGLLDCSSLVLEAAQNSEQMLEQLLACAPAEMNLQVLGEEVKKTSRRINALEEHLLPRLREEVAFIRSVLDEREREDTFRLKRIKKKKSEKKAE